MKYKGIKKALDILKRGAVGGSIGYVASRATSSSHEAPDNASSGALVGAALAIGAPIVARKIKTSKSVQAVRATARKGSYIFRRIGGRIIPIKKK